MSRFSSEPSLPVLVSRLRAAGCVFAEEEAAVLRSAAGSAGELAGMVDRRIAGRPLEYIVGWAEFRGLRIAVEPGVFVPRKRTEFLVEQAVTVTRPGAVVVDLGCGAGAIGAAIAAAVDVHLYATDIDPAAVRCARRNLLGTAEVFQGDLYDPLPTGLLGRVDVLAVNAPYVPTDAIALMPPEARLFESTVALDGGADGLDIQRRVAAQAPRWLAPGGHLLIETSERQAPRTAEAVAGARLHPRIARDDEMDATVVTGQLDEVPVWPSRTAHGKQAER